MRRVGIEDQVTFTCVGGGGKQPSDYENGYCTIGDIMKQMAFALSTPFDSSAGGD